MNKETNDTAALYSFFWRRSCSNADECFVISFGAAEQDAIAEGHYLNCVFRASDGEFVECIDIPVTEQQWINLDSMLRTVSLPDYSPPDEFTMDAADSCIEIRREENGCRFTNRFSGEYAHDLRSFLNSLIGQITGRI